ncbi:M20/M25/M40 family metallo-hydrolase [Janibacter hoylei]|uniref:Acetylornithine deacetylase n=1 Tax=Janibacter hoylei PVAS-1 TaxID=1210046 RepID=A0A444B5N0_9MICO|nr:M20/M25/M40 family metallo-hydrolase [Janibacter hoylei]RWU83707.1 acetylornithine deacetylase [Janibacter hoylei PVAS-1]
MATTEAPSVTALREVLRLHTVASDDPDRTDPAPFVELHAVLRRHFPRVHEAGEVVDVPPHGLLIRVPADPGSPTCDADPVVLMAHMDVVPIGDESLWTHPPLAAEVVDGMIWGRGTLDDKGQLVAVMAAVESLLAEGLAPARDVWLSFGSDEEVMGTCALAAVELLRERGVRPWFVLDEGGAVASDAFPGVTRSLGVVGVSEKGVLSLRLTASGRGGHASRPAKGGPAARIAAAITRLERHPFPAHVSPATLEMLGRLVPHLPRALRPVVARAERAPSLLARVLVAAGPEAAALARTTVAVTTLSGSPAINVNPTSVVAGLNLRIAVGETTAAATERIRRVVGRTIDVEVAEAHEPSPLSPTDDPAFALLERTVTTVFPEAVPVPYVMYAATDARHFTTICPRVYRFAPFRMSAEQRESIHSYDERLGVQDFLDGVRWYRTLLDGLTHESVAAAVAG